MSAGRRAARAFVWLFPRFAAVVAREVNYRDERALCAVFGELPPSVGGAA